MPVGMIVKLHLLYEKLMRIYSESVYACGTANETLGEARD